MEASKRILREIGWIKVSEDFVVGRDNFSELEIGQAEGVENLHYFHHKKIGLIKQFVLDSKQQVDYICRVILIKKGDKFTPRLSFSVRDKQRKIVEKEEQKSTNIKANVSLDDCHENLWKLINFLQTLREIDLPEEKFSLISKDEDEIISALKTRDSESIISIIKKLASTPDLTLTRVDVNAILNRENKLNDFQASLKENSDSESWWQSFFEKNKWIFGYGLNYIILKEEQAQPVYGGVSYDGRGGQKGDYLMRTSGVLHFTALVEIKTPATKLLTGSKEIRNGAWSLSKDLTDAVSQIQANIHIWEKQGSETTQNKDKLEKKSIYTVRPKGIVIVGSLEELMNDRSRWETFQRFRNSLHGIEIITFDELLERARFIVEDDQQEPL
ncbi:MAG: Shedu immune nuclease family protein [Parcubacteria group bacterium]